MARDLGSVDLWDRSLARSRQRRRLAELGRRARRRRKSASLAVSAAIAAGPVIPPAVAAADAGSGTTAAGSTDLGNDGLLQASARHVVLRMGSSGALVAAAQRRLDEVLPLTHLVVDGIYGPLTRQAVREFQHRHNLDATGAIDVRTWAVMFRAPVLVFGGAAGTSSVAPATTAAAGVSAAAPVSSPAGQASAHRYFAGAAVDRHRAGTAAATGETAGQTAHRVGAAADPRAPATGSAQSTGTTGSGGSPSSDATGTGGPADTGQSPGAGGSGVPARPHSSAPPPVAVVAPSGSTTTQPSTYVLSNGVALPLPRQYITNGYVDQGVDYAAPGGTPLYAMGGGVIIGEGISGFGPNAPILQITSGPLKGLEVYYGHAGSNLVHVGQHVQAGQQISQVGYGIVGISTGPHLEIGFYPPGSMGAGSRMLSLINGLLSQHPSGRAWGTGSPTAVAAGRPRATNATPVSYTVRRSTAAAGTASPAASSSSGGAALTVAQAAPAATASTAPVVTAAPPAAPATPAAAPATAATTTPTAAATTTTTAPARLPRPPPPLPRRRRPPRLSRRRPRRRRPR